VTIDASFIGLKFETFKRDELMFKGRYLIRSD